MPNEKAHKPATLSIHADMPHNETNSLSPPIYQTTTFRADNAEAFLEMAVTPHHPQFYTRYGNPNHAQAEAVIAALEGAEAALLTSSGMGAFVALSMCFLEAGDHVVAQQVHYGGTIGFLENMLAKFGVTTTFVDQTDASAFAEAIQANTKLIITETPTNPMMILTDLKAIADLGKQHGILTVCDNTFATPINQNPLNFGIDLVFHSATKYLGGHHDLIMGAIAGSQILIEQIWRTSISVGVSVNAFDSWLLLRGLRTLKLRVHEHNNNARQIAERLELHPAVEHVYYPGLASHPQHELAQQQMQGFTGMLSFVLKGDKYQAEAFLSKLKLIDRAASLGGVHSIIVHPAAMLAAVLTEEQFIERGIPLNLVRLSVGLEDIEDLWADIEQALG